MAIQPGSSAELERVVQVLSPVVDALAAADRHRSDNETQRYQRQLESWDAEAKRADRRFLALLGVVSLVVLLLIGFAFYAYTTGSPPVATHTITAVLSFLGGIAAGMGLRRRQ